jgi:hypothetical protein
MIALQTHRPCPRPGARRRRRRARCRRALCAVVALAASIAATGVFAATTRSAPPHYDGLWSVLIVTEKGNCDPGYRYPIRIVHGVLANAGAVGFTVAGRVARSGALTVTVSNGSSSATGSGRLAGDIGTGFWHGGSCSGTWTAERRSS